MFAALSGISDETNGPILNVPSLPVVLTIPLSVVFNFEADEANVAVAALPVKFPVTLLNVTSEEVPTAWPIETLPLETVTPVPAVTVALLPAAPTKETPDGQFPLALGPKILFEEVLM